MKPDKPKKPKKPKKPEPITLQGIILSDASWDVKLEAIRGTNPLFYLLTPRPRPRPQKKGSNHGI